MKSYDRAVKEANKLVELLEKSWEPIVWENLGWYFGARVDATWKITPDIRDSSVDGIYDILSWRASFNFSGISHTVYDETPIKALKKLKRSVGKTIEQIQKDLNEI